MRLYRLASRRHARRLDGAGNRDGGARWNSGRGRGVIYTSLNVSTCVLEMLVHFGPHLRARLPRNLTLVTLEAPDNAETEIIAAADIPKQALRMDSDGRNWFQRTGDAWLDRGTALMLLAPSLVSMHDGNVVLNPAHRAMANVRILEIEPYRFDPRLALPAD